MIQHRTQYASVIFCDDQHQFKIANKIKAELQGLIDFKVLTCFKNNVVATDIRMVETDFFVAHQAHQEYLENNPRGYCNHRIRFTEWPAP
jgi:peptide-methionine (S)-S-oxide reductase